MAEPVRGLLYEGLLGPLLDAIGARPLRDLSAGDVRSGLGKLADRYSTRSLQITRLSLERAIRHAEADDLVGRNVAALVKAPQGRSGRPSKSFTLQEAKAAAGRADADLRTGITVTGVRRDRRGQVAGVYGHDRSGAPVCTPSADARAARRRAGSRAAAFGELPERSAPSTSAPWPAWPPPALRARPAGGPTVMDPDKLTAARARRARMAVPWRSPNAPPTRFDLPGREGPVYIAIQQWALEPWEGEDPLDLGRS